MVPGQPVQDSIYQHKTGDESTAEGVLQRGDLLEELLL